MKAVIPTQTLSCLIGKCLNVVPQKATIPILSNILMEASNGLIRLTATDLVVGVCCFAEANIIEEGTVALPAKKLAQLVRELTSANVEITATPEGRAEIVADSSRFRLHGMNASTFPSWPGLEGTVRCVLKQSELKDVLFRTAFTVSREDNRYVLTGVFLRISNRQATFMGTDGKRLSRSFLPVDVDEDFSGNFVIPLKAVEEILKNLTEEGEATLHLMADKIAVQTHDTTVISKLLSGEYPDVMRIIPTAVPNSILLHREELISLLRQTSLFGGEESPIVRFTFHEGELRLSANTMEVGEGNVSMPANYHGDKLDIAFNPTYFLDFLRHSRGETVTLGLIDSYNPGIIVDQDSAAVSSTEANPLFLLMPMRFNDS
jgi:DNA polymerase-3 subunit beta